MEELRTIVFPGIGGIRFGRVEGRPCLIVAVVGRNWLGLFWGGNGEHDWIERHHRDTYEILIIGPITWQWSNGVESQNVDYYEFLGVAREASRREILAAYEGLPAAVRRSDTAILCRDTLADPAKRKQYDAALADYTAEVRQAQARLRWRWSILVICIGMVIGRLWTL